MAGIDIQPGGSKREVNSDVNMIPFIDMLLVTIAFLLITAVWVSFSRVEVQANVPGVEQGPTPPVTDKTLHVFVQGDAFVVSWRQASTVISETRIPRPETVAGLDPKYDDLAKLIEREWAQHGGHKDPSDHHQDLAVLHAENQMPFREMVAVIDAIHGAKRDFVHAGARQKVSAFSTSLAAR